MMKLLQRRRERRAAAESARTETAITWDIRMAEALAAADLDRELQHLLNGR